MPEIKNVKIDINGHAFIQGIYDAEKDTYVIPEGAFKNNIEFTDITIDEKVRIIGNGAFFGCTNLRRITLPEGLTTIGRGAFSGCTNLRHIRLPEGLMMIREGAFFGCSNLYHITLPEGLTTINEYTFCGCCSLSHVTFPESLKTIEMGAFIDCTNLRYIIIDTDNKEHYDAVKEMYNRPFMFYKEGDILPFELCQAIQQTRKQYRLKMQTAILNQQPHLLTALNTIVASYMIDKPTKVAAIGFFKDALPLPANIIKLVQAYSDLPLLFDSKQTIEDVAPPSCMAEIETYRQNLQKCIDALLPAAIINIEEECREERQENEEEKAMPRGAFFKEPLGDEAPKDNRSGAYKQSSCCIS